MFHEEGSTNPPIVKHWGVEEGGGMIKDLIIAVDEVAMKPHQLLDPNA
jgi:hypothetical protein